MCDVEKVMLTFADCEKLTDDCFCLAVCPVAWRQGDPYLFMYAGESLASCIDQAIADKQINLQRLESLLTHEGWEAARRIHDIFGLLHRHQVENVLRKTAFYRKYAVWRVGSLRDFLTSKK